jgi:hypothetical protein
MVNRNWYRREVLPDIAAWAAARSDFPAAIDGDPRHRALNWLCGYAEHWDDVPIDT